MNSLLLGVFVCLVSVASSQLPESGPQCAQRLEGHVSSCWTTTKNAPQWACPDSPMKQCFETYDSDSVCSHFDEYRARKQDYLDQITVFDKWFCRTNFRNEIIRNTECGTILDVVGWVSRNAYKPEKECISEHFELQKKLRDPSNTKCRNQQISSMMHEALQIVVCKDSPSVPWTEFATVTDDNYTICETAVEALKICKDKFDFSTACTNSPIVTCIENEFEKSRACPMKAVERWKEVTSKQFRDRQDVMCESSVHSALKSDSAICLKNSFTERVLFQYPTAPTKEACTGQQSQMEEAAKKLSEGQLSDGMCSGVVKFHIELYNKICFPKSTKQPATSAPTGSNGQSAHSPLLLLAVLAILMATLF